MTTLATSVLDSSEEALCLIIDILCAVDGRRDCEHYRTISALSFTFDALMSRSDVPYWDRCSTAANLARLDQTCEQLRDLLASARHYSPSRLGFLPSNTTSRRRPIYSSGSTIFSQ